MQESIEQQLNLLKNTFFDLPASQKRFYPTDPGLHSQYSQQQLVPKPSSIYTEIFSPKKNWFFARKKFFPFLFFLPFFNATFQCGHYINHLQFFFYDHENIKKWASKVAHNRPKPFIPQSSPAHSPFNSRMTF